MIHLHHWFASSAHGFANLISLAWVLLLGTRVTGLERGPAASPADLTRPARALAQTGSDVQFLTRPEAGLVSVIIPTYNRAHILRHAIDAALAQTYPNIQVVVADDGSTDDTRAAVDSYDSRVTYVRQENAGVSAARNVGMRHARGEFIAFLDSDDSWLPWKIEAQVAALARHRAAGVVWTDMTATDDAGHVLRDRYLRTMYSAYDSVTIENLLNQVDTLGALTTSVPDKIAASPVRQGDLFSAILLGNLLHTSTVLLRRSRVELTGGFDETFARTGEDYEFYVRLCSAGPVVFIDAPSIYYRVGAADQLTRPSMTLEMARNNLRTVEKWIPQSAPHIDLAPIAIQQRFAESLAWVGEAELDVGHRGQAARRLWESLMKRPGFDRRMLLLCTCALPRSVADGLRAARRALTTGERA